MKKDTFKKKRKIRVLGLIKLVGKTFDELLEGAQTIHDNEIPESNTNVLVGGQLIDMVGKMKEMGENSNLSINRYVIYSSNENGLSAIRSGNNVTVSLSKIGVGLLASENPNGFRWFEGINDVLLQNGDGIIANLQTGMIEKLTAVFGQGYKQFMSADKLLLYINLYGIVVSPFGNLQKAAAEIQDGTKYIKLNGGDISNKINLKQNIINCFDRKEVGKNPFYTPNIVGLSNYNVSDFILKRDGTNFSQPDCYSEKAGNSGDSGMMYSFNIPLCKKIIFSFEYRSNMDVATGLYERNASGWINNPGVVQKILPPESNPQTKIITIERTYETGATQAVLSFGSTTSPLGIMSSNIDFEIGFLKAECLGVIEDADINVITVASDGSGNFTSIRNAVNSITEASSYNPYKVFVKNGTYNEIDIKTKDYVDVEGESRDGVIVYTDGTSTENSPADYNWKPEYRNVPVNTIPKAWKHQWIHMSNSEIRNMTLVGNQTKYVIHQDNQNNSYEAKCKNCKFIRKEDYNYSTTDYDRGLVYCIGIGATQGQYQRFEDCMFEWYIDNFPNIPLTEPTAIIWHNWNNKTIPCGASIVNCLTFGGNLLNAAELGSETDDVINIIDCKTDDAKFGIFYSVTTGYYIPPGESSPTQNPERIPYCIRLNIKNSKINSVVLQKGRENGFSKILNPETVMLIKVQTGIQIGTPLLVPKNGYFTTSIATGRDFVLAMQPSSVETYIYANSGIRGRGLALAGNYTFGDNLYISNGKFTKTQTGEIVATVISNQSLITEGLIDLSKIR
ncbi:hypothetical protein EZS27_024835 [termite gut metagenome]|uniref:Uncharacterized protein n=1 Tax=termite gut metagenome TaxID=433724 RepID=A0A5J4QWW1_9ZZZZ